MPSLLTTSQVDYRPNALMDFDTDDGAGSTITPVFKQRSSKSASKGKGRANIAAEADDDMLASERHKGNEDDDAPVPAIVFRSKNKDRKPSAVGARSTSKASTPSGKLIQNRSSSKLSLSFGDDDMHQEIDSSDSAVKRPIERERTLKRPAPQSNPSGFNIVGPLPGADLGANQAAARNLAASLSQTSLNSSAPSYSSSYLAELKASTQSAPPRSGQAADPERLADWYSSQANHSGVDLGLSRYGDASALFADEDTNMSALLPTQSIISSAKAKRETARRIGLSDTDMSAFENGDDFISLGGKPSTSTALAYPSKSGSSRLARESDEEAGLSEDEAHSEFTGGGERIALGKKARKAAAKGRRQEIRDLIEGNDDATVEPYEVDEDEQRWQDDLIRRGAAQSTTSTNGTTVAVYKSAPIPDPSALPTGAAVAARLAASLTELRSTRSQADSLLLQLDNERAAISKQTEELRAEIDRVSSKFEWYTAFKEWSEDIASFLEDKFPVLEKIEADNLSVQRERMQLIEERRYKDESDDLASFTGASVPLNWELQPANDEVNNGEVNGTEAGQSGAEVDEFGRSVGISNDLTPKSSSRKIRRLERARRRIMLPSSAYTGFETEDELQTSDASDLKSAGTALLKDVSVLFADVQADEFKDPDIGIKPKFKEWLAKFPDDFNNAFGGLAMVGVWEFWARSEMAAWNPFGIAQLPMPRVGLDSYEWQKALSLFQHERESGPSAASADAEDSVLTGIVSTVIMPRLRKLASDAYDPLSSTATTRSLALLEELTYVIEPTHTRFVYLVTTFLARFQVYAQRYATLILPHLGELRNPTILLDTEAIESRNCFARRLSKLISMAVRWRRYARRLILPLGSAPGAGSSWDLFIDDELVRKLALPVLQAGWQTGGDEIAEEIKASCPVGVLQPSTLAMLLSA